MSTISSEQPSSPTSSEPRGSEPVHSSTHGRKNGRSKWLAFAILMLLVALGSSLRIGKTLGDENFANNEPSALLITDQGLIHYTAKRILAAGGGVPEDFRADPRIEHPEVSDIPSMFTVGQEFLVSWLHIATGQRFELHILALIVMSICASLTVVGVFGLTFELTHQKERTRLAWASLAGLLFLALPINYRTIGFVWIREDFSLPFFALHLYFCARTLRVRTVGSFFAAGLCMGLAAATWHAMGSYLLIEAACVGLWWLRSQQNPLAHAKAYGFPLGLTLVCLSVPVLRSKLFLLSMPALVVWSLWLSGRFDSRSDSPSGQPKRMLQLARFAGAFVLLFLFSAWLSRQSGSGLSDYSHVFELLSAKLKNFGVRPAEPDQMSFGARLLWQGPFATSPPSIFSQGMGLALLGVALGLVAFLPIWWQRTNGTNANNDPHENETENAIVRPLCAILLVFSLGAITVTYLIVRTQVLTGILLPPLAAASAAHFTRKTLVGARKGQALFGVLALVQVGLCLQLILSQPIGWYQWPDPVRLQERTHLCEWVKANIPPGEPLAADFVLGAALLAHTDHPSLLQPKYETRRSRDRIESFFTEFYFGTLDSLHGWIRAQDCRYLVIDRPFVSGNAYLAGLSPKATGPLPRTPAMAYLHPDSKIRAQIPGTKLLYTSPPEMRFESFQVYDLGPRKNSAPQQTTTLQD